MARYNTPEGMVWSKKTPGDFPWGMHQAMLAAPIGSEAILDSYRDVDEAERQARIIRQLFKMIYDYPLHSTTRQLAARGGAKQGWKTRIIMKAPDCFELRVYGAHNVRNYEQFLTPIVLARK